LDGEGNSQMTQTFYFDSNMNLITNPPINSFTNPFPDKSLPYTLEFDWGANIFGNNKIDSFYG